MPRILMTGAAGGIGTSLRKLLPPIYPDLLLSDIKAPADLGSNEKFKAAESRRSRAGRGDLRRRRRHPAFRRLFGRRPVGRHPAVQHHRLLQSVRGGAQARASSAWCSPRRTTRSASIRAITGSAPTSRRGRTAATASARCSARRSARSMPTSTGCSVTCLRIGNFGDKPLDHRRLSIWLKPEDLVQLCRIGLEHPDIHFEIFYGASYNERSWWDNHRAYDLGYRPTGRAEDFREHAMAEQAKLQAGSGRRFLPGRRVLQHGVRRRHEPDHRLEIAS